MMEQKYKIVETNTVTELEAEINRLLVEGYEVVGGVCLAKYLINGQVGERYVQALITKK